MLSCRLKGTVHQIINVCLNLIFVIAMGGGIAHLNWILKEELKKSIKKLSLYRSMNNSIYVRPNNAVFLVNKRCTIHSINRLWMLLQQKCFILHCQLGWMWQYWLVHIKVLKVTFELPLYMGVTGLVCSHFLMFGNAPTIATRAERAGQLVKSPSSIRAFGWLGRGTFIELTNW